MQTLSNWCITNTVSTCKINTSYHTLTHLTAKPPLPELYATRVTSENVKLDLIVHNNEYLMTLKPDAEWLNSTDRRFPIVIDPTASTLLGANDIKDTFITS